MGWWWWNGGCRINEISYTLQDLKESEIDSFDKTRHEGLWPCEGSNRSRNDKEDLDDLGSPTPLLAATTAAALKSQEPTATFPTAKSGRGFRPQKGSVLPPEQFLGHADVFSYFLRVVGHR